MYNYGSHDRKWSQVLVNICSHIIYEAAPWQLIGAYQHWLPVASQIWSRLGNYMGGKELTITALIIFSKGLHYFVLTQVWQLLSLSLLCLPPSLLLVSLVMMIRVILKRLIENALLRELAPNWKRISNDSILWLSPQSHYFANVMDQPSQLQPLLVRVNSSNPLGSLKAVHRVRHGRLDI